MKLPSIGLNTRTFPAQSLKLDLAGSVLQSVRRMATISVCRLEFSTLVFS